MKKYLLVVTGPTAVGKTALCIDLAAHFHTEIVNADSRQIYKYLNIGTAKPTAEEQAAIPHHLIDFLHPKEPYSAGQFEEDALRKIGVLMAQKEVVVLTGGSGLYIKAVCEGMDEVPGSLEMRERLTEEFEESGLEPLLEELFTADPVYFGEVDRANPHRVMRALEVIRTSGKPFSSFRSSQPKDRPFKIIKVGLNRDREELYQRINARMDIMLENGLLEEAKAWFPYRAYNSLQTVGYQELFGHWEGRYDFEEAVRLLKRNSRRYAKRQMTWFRRDPEIHWFHPDQKKAIIQLVEREIQK